MCGIVAVVGKSIIPISLMRMFKTMLCLDTIRGPHSTGVLSIGPSGYEIKKKVGTPWDLFDEVYKEEFLTSSKTVLIGHNRYATSGGISEETAHPFKEGSIIGVHNGTLHNRSSMKYWNDFKVDSQAIFNSINNKGELETIENIFGTYCLMWYDTKNGTINISRNYARPLKAAKTVDGKFHIFASEDWMIKISAGKNKVAITEVKDIAVDIIYKYDIVGKGELAPEPKEISVNKKIITSYYGNGSSSYGTNNYNNEEYYYNGTPKNKKQNDFGGEVLYGFRKTPKWFKKLFSGSLNYYAIQNVSFEVIDVKEKLVNGIYSVLCKSQLDTRIKARLFVKEADVDFNKLSVKGNKFTATINNCIVVNKNEVFVVLNKTSILPLASTNILVLPKRYTGYYGEPLLESQWDESTKDGCASCSADLDKEDCGLITWFDANTAFCPECSKDEELVGFTNWSKVT